MGKAIGRFKQSRKCSLGEGGNLADPTRIESMHRQLQILYLLLLFQILQSLQISLVESELDIFWIMPLETAGSRKCGTS